MGWIHNTWYKFVSFGGDVLKNHTNVLLEQFNVNVNVPNINLFYLMLIFKKHYKYQFKISYVNVNVCESSPEIICNKKVYNTT